MKHLLLLLQAVIILFATSCSKDRITGGGSSKTEIRNTPSFNAVSVLGSGTVNITKGNALKVEVYGYENLLPYFETNVINNELRVGYRNGVNIRNDNIKVYITMPADIAFLNIQGSGNISVKGNFINNASVDLLINGSGNIDFESGTAPKAVLRINGSGNINAYGLNVNESDAGITGSGNIKTSLLNKLTASVSGSGNIYYKGNPTIINSTVTGSGKVIKQ
jgi:Putative auto-transporter adhesin, head GIN domain